MTIQQENTIAVDHLAVRYGKREALSDITFQVDEGSFVAILGPNGSGKTSLIKVLLGIVAPSSGRAHVLGRSPSTLKGGQVGYVPQVKTLERRFPAVALELVISGARGRWPARRGSSETRRATAALERVGAGHLADRQLSTLSGGELQRVFLARSLIREPKVVMLDEPAAGVDVSGTADLYDLLENYQQDHHATILMVTHDWNVAFHHASHALILNRKQICFGPSKTALTEENLRKAFGHVGHAHGMYHGGVDD